MNRHLSILQFKQACADYHYSQAQAALKNLAAGQAHILIAEFSAMLEVLHTGIHLARVSAYKQSTVDVKAYMNSLDAATLEELRYLEQLVQANRIDHLFDISDALDITIQPIQKRNERGSYEARSLIPYMSEVKQFADGLIQAMVNIYTSSSAHYDQSWRTVDLHRASYYCRVCGAPVTKIMSHLGNLSGISLKEKESYLPRATYVYGHEVIKAELLPWNGSNEITEDELVISIDSLGRDVRKDPAPGCCGPDSSVLNVFCREGHPIGREAADCYMPHCIRLPLTHVQRLETLDFI
ncbi:hypothetical protein SAMN02799630_04652 [Paenibacillus sp. UNCCL117]|uniref:hypothetical protein n=1 Tax=unclassified Paenibacillus TaxID=185978 RepID=UPI00088BAB1A|nr:MULTISPECIES: hypothetical protein [unclassified Paenibacillus]SDE07306.1 hypothetical protein SAMN04488602_11843 [Paenibacillus sp. cl123]SFW59195.1 hypothetical protein SAMN02799630_04652 [Paenibacillus sp. UNCCL117]